MDTSDSLIDYLVGEQDFNKALYHLITTTNKDGHSASVRAVFNHNHSVLGCSEGNLLYQASRAKFLRAQFFKTRDNSFVD